MNQSQSGLKLGGNEYQVVNKDFTPLSTRLAKAQVTAAFSKPGKIKAPKVKNVAPAKVQQACRTPKPSIAARRRQRERANGRGWTEAQWHELLAAFGCQCLRCGETNRLVPDHVVPLIKGGRHDISNIQPLCYKCNLWKGMKVIDYRG